MGWIEDVRNFAAQSILHRAGVYTLTAFLAGILATIILTALHLPTTPAYAIFFMMLLMVGGFYLIDPENEYTVEDVVSVFLASVIVVVLMALFGYSAQVTLIKQYAAPLVYMQEAANAAASATGVAKTDVLGLFLMNFLEWTGGLFGALGAKYIITQRA